MKRFLNILPDAVATIEVALIDESAQHVDWRGTLSAWIDANRDGLAAKDISQAVACLGSRRCYRVGGGAAPAMLLAPIVLGHHLDKKWRDDSPDHPPCALCDRLIQGVDTAGDEIGAIRVFWAKGQEKEMAFHPACFACVTFP